MKGWEETYCLGFFSPEILFKVSQALSYFSGPKSVKEITAGTIMKHVLTHLLFCSERPGPKGSSSQTFSIYIFFILKKKNPTRVEEKDLKFNHIFESKQKNRAQIL